MVGPCHRLRLWQEDDQPRPLVVFFGAKDLQESQFNFPSLSQDLVAHCLLLNNGANQWYQGTIPGFANSADAVSVMVRRWADALGATGLICIGTSMGAYGAMVHGARLGARVLAFATDHAIGTPGSQSARHFRYSGVAPFPDLASVIAKASPGFEALLFAGEREAADLYALAQLQGLPGVTGRTIVGADHFVPTRLSRRGQLGRLLHRFVAGDALPDLPLTGRALDRPGYIDAAYQALIALDRGEAALDFAQMAHDLWPDGEAGQLLLGRALLADRQFDAASGMFLRALVSAPEDLATMALLAQCQRELGRMDAAIALHEQILLKEPDRHASMYSLGLIWQKLGALDKAAAQLRMALRFSPGNPHYTKRLAAISTLIDRQK